MTIAELLVQAEATLFAASDFRAMVEAQIRVIVDQQPPSFGQLQAARDAGRESAAKEARRIVAAVYGEPCGDPGLWGDPFDNNHAILKTEPPAACDTCLSCGWPRSSHK